MFRDWTEPTLFRAGTVPETVPVRSLADDVMFSTVFFTSTHRLFRQSHACMNLFLLFHAHKRPSPFFYTYPTKNPLLMIIDQFLLAGIC